MFLSVPTQRDASEQAFMEIYSPIDQSLLEHVPLLSVKSSLEKVEMAQKAFRSWKRVSLDERIAYINKFIDCFMSKKHEICQELSKYMGRQVFLNVNDVRPCKQNYVELLGFEMRARHMVQIASDCLKDYFMPPKEEFYRFIRREPLGVAFILAPWNYPYMCMVHSIVPALLAGNTVLLKQSPQTYICGERFKQAFQEAGLPVGVFQNLIVDHHAAAAVMSHPSVTFLQFTGSVKGGLEINATLSHKLITRQLELGGKDPAYIRHDADLDYAAEQVMFMTMYNSGQSCFGVERIYVHQEVYDEFIQKCRRVLEKYRLGDPLDPDTTIGPVVSLKLADWIRTHIQEAIDQGAVPLLDSNLFPKAQPGTCYIAPQLLLNVDHSMRIMREETFGPVAGVIKVASDQQAIQLMNDSEFGLTCSIWTQDADAALRIGDEIETGTVYMNRGDLLDPSMPWVGVKQSGIGITLSHLGFDVLTRPKSFHFRLHNDAAPPLNSTVQVARDVAPSKNRSFFPTWDQEMPNSIIQQHSSTIDAMHK